MLLVINFLFILYTIIVLSLSPLLSQESETQPTQEKMGRGKIEIKRIENTNNRQVTYSKRRKGLIKKAKEITVLCDAAVSVVIFASPTKLYEYCSPSTNITEMLDRYHQHSGQRLWNPEHEALSNEIKRIKEENEKMQIDLRHLNAEDITSLNIKELMTIENDLENGLISIGEKRRESYKRMQKDGQRLEEENMHLRYVYEQQMEAMAGKVRDIENGFNHLKVNDQYEAQMPFAFRLQPNQPNLHNQMLLD